MPVSHPFLPSRASLSCLVLGQHLFFFSFLALIDELFPAYLKFMLWPGCRGSLLNVSVPPSAPHFQVCTFPCRNDYIQTSEQGTVSLRCTKMGLFITRGSALLVFSSNSILGDSPSFRLLHLFLLVSQRGLDLHL